MSPKSDNVRCGYGSRLKPNSSLAQGKRKCLGGCLRTVGLKTGMLNCLTAYGVWRLLRDLALIKVRLLRRRQLAGCVYMSRVTLLLAILLLKFYFMYTLIPCNCLSVQTCSLLFYFIFKLFVRIKSKTQKCYIYEEKAKEKASNSHIWYFIDIWHFSLKHYWNNWLIIKAVNDYFVVDKFFNYFINNFSSSFELWGGSSPGTYRCSHWAWMT